MKFWNVKSVLQKVLFMYVKKNRKKFI
jgi:hypothetical protein